MGTNMNEMCKDHGCVISFNAGLSGCGMKNVVAVFSNDFNRKAAGELESHIDENWTDFKKQIKILYNAEKFRINSVKTIDNKALLEVGLTCYKDYIGTNLGKHLELFRAYGIESFGNRQACLSDTLGVGSMLITSDEYFLFVRRSFEVAEGRGLTDFPGGHAEPKEMAKRIGAKEVNLLSMKSEDVVHEIFYSMVREVRDEGPLIKYGISRGMEEINIPETSLSWPSLLGFLRNCENGNKPHAAFLIRCDLTKEKIIDLFNQGGPEAYESTEIMFFKEKELLEMSPNELKSLGELTPCAKATLYLYFNGYKSTS